MRDTFYYETYCSLSSAIGLVTPSNFVRLRLSLDLMNHSIKAMFASSAGNVRVNNYVNFIVTTIRTKCVIKR